MVERPTFVIAEAGVNHQGSLERALEMVDAACAAGADAVKFQTFRSDRLVTRNAAKAAYQAARTGAGGTQLDMLKGLELSPADHEVLLARCRLRSIQFLSTAFDAESLALLARLGVPLVKIPSGDVTAGPLVLRAARLRLPMIVSTGMCSLADVEQVLGVIAYGLVGGDGAPGPGDFEAAYAGADGRRALEENVTLLHCVTRYPCPPEAVNLRAMDTLASAFGLRVGYSDHTLGIEVALAAVARGASVLEKHFTMDRRLPGPDHAASLEPDELARMVAGIRAVERSLGSPRKQALATELGTRAAARRSLVAARPIAKGEVFVEDALEAKRPGTGLSPMLHWRTLGRTAVRSFEPDEPIEW